MCCSWFGCLFLFRSVVALCLFTQNLGLVCCLFLLELFPERQFIPFPPQKKPHLGTCFYLLVFGVSSCCARVFSGRCCLSLGFCLDTFFNLWFPLPSLFGLSVVLSSDSWYGFLHYCWVLLVALLWGLLFCWLLWLRSLFTNFFVLFLFLFCFLLLLLILDVAVSFLLLFIALPFFPFRCPFLLF